MAACLLSVLCLLSGSDVLFCCGCGVEVLSDAAGFGDLVDVRDCDWDCAGGGRDILSGRAPLHALRVVSLCAAQQIGMRTVVRCPLWQEMKSV